ncbi:MAG: ral secretion pathway protein, partial [Candidatus Eremiobacteraeota bacterium]|nr:ral secretion pathway protein [Candidatus Eremiobacteraeota bacterium]
MVCTVELLEPFKRAAASFSCVAVAAAFLNGAVSASPRAPRPAAARVTLRAQNEPVRAVLMHVARDTGANISVGEGLSGYVTVELHDATLAQALEAILGPVGATYRVRRGVYNVEAGAGAARAPGGGPVTATAPSVLTLTVMPAKRAAAVLRPLFPQASVREDEGANALVVVASAPDLQAMRAVLQGIDVRNPALPVTEAFTLHTARASSLAQQLHGAFPAAKFGIAGDKQLIATARPSDIAQIRSTIAALDAPSATPPPTAASSEAVRVSQRSPRDVARAVVSQVSGLRASVAGGTVVLSGPPEAVSRGKTLIAQLDLPSFGERYTQVYRIRTLDATSVGDLLRRSFRDLDLTVDVKLNAIAVTAANALQQRIGDAIAQLDPAPGAQPYAGSVGSSGGGSSEVVTLKSYVPGPPSQGAPDAVTAITQALQVVAPDVRVAQLPTAGQIALIGPPQSVRTAREFIDKVDIVPPLVVLDTEVLEIDESVAKDLGLQLGTVAVSTTFSEMGPQPNVDGTPAQLGRFQAFTRTPVSFTAQLNLLVQNGKGRVLADPRITTLSGRTASIRAGDTISILTTTAGNAGTIATTQVQSFQTGVTLDITPSVTPDGGIMVALHPVVNSLIGTNGGVPEISTRDTQTTVHLRNDETLVIGGLIQENETRSTTKLPLLGDIPLLGRVFRNENVQGQRNELIIVVTPHIVVPGSAAMPGPALRALPTPAALPTLPPNAQLPPPSGQLPGQTLTSNTRAALPSHALASPGPVAPPSPAAVPAAFAQTNVFSFGTAPQSNFAKPTDPVQIFYATLSPTVVSNGTSIRVAAVTTTNTSALRLQIGTQSIGLGQTGPGQWQAAFPFPLGAVAVGQTSVQLSLLASRADGASATVP